MFNAKFDFDRSLDNALKLVMERTDASSEAEALELALIITRRDAAVVRMSRAEPFSEAWNKASFDIVQQECLLAPHGLV